MTTGVSHGAHAGRGPPLVESLRVVCGARAARRWTASDFPGCSSRSPARLVRSRPPQSRLTVYAVSPVASGRRAGARRGSALTAARRQARPRPSRGGLDYPRPVLPLTFAALAIAAAAVRAGAGEPATALEWAAKETGGARVSRGAALAAVLAWASAGRRGERALTLAMAGFLALVLAEEVDWGSVYGWPALGQRRGGVRPPQHAQRGAGRRTSCSRCRWSVITWSSGQVDGRPAGAADRDARRAVGVRRGGGAVHRRQRRRPGAGRPGGARAAGYALLRYRAPARRAPG